jgi:four helix bundle protein
VLGVGEMVVTSFRDLRVWQSGMDLVERIYRVTERFPQREMFGLAAQMQRAAVSIPSNIAEGHMRSHRREYLHFVSVAHGSLAELQTQIEIAQRLGYLALADSQDLLERTTVLSRQLHKLRGALAESLNPQAPTPNP